MHSLKQKTLDFCKPVLRRVQEELNIELLTTEEILLKKNLKKYSPPLRNMDGCILVHRSSGRLLITDKNGIYDQFIRKMYNRTGKLTLSFTPLD
jgi:hypothetical protein